MMKKQEELFDRRRYEKRGVAIKTQALGRPPSEEMLEAIHSQFSQKYGEGWKIDSVYPGSIFVDSQIPEIEDGHMVIFKRRNQLRDE